MRDTQIITEYNPNQRLFNDIKQAIAKRLEIVINGRLAVEQAPSIGTAIYNATMLLIGRSSRESQMDLLTQLRKVQA